MTDVFEIEDFTTVSDWEKFVAKLEELLHDWRVGSFQLTATTTDEDNSWHEVNEEIRFGGSEYHLSRHWTSQGDVNTKQSDEPLFVADMLDRTKDFPARAHCIARWYGVYDFVLLTPTQVVVSSSEARLLHSSIQLAASATKSKIPIFLQLGQPWRKLYRGFFSNRIFKTDFQMVHLRSVPKEYTYLRGLLTLLKQHIASPVWPEPSVEVAIRFTYSVSDWARVSWHYCQDDLHSLLDFDWTNFKRLPFGACQEPVQELSVSVMWPQLFGDSTVENESFSDLDPKSAPEWSARVRLVSAEQCRCLSADFIRSFITMSTSSYDVFNYNEGSVGEAAVALSRLTGDTPSLGDTVASAASDWLVRTHERLARSHKLPEELLDEIAQHLFSTESTDEDYSLPFLAQVAASPAGSFTQRLAIACCVVFVSIGGAAGFQQLWSRVCHELRTRWDNCILVPGLQAGAPNLAYSSLYQKLQLLNCCISHRIELSKRKSDDAEDVPDVTDDDDEEFYDCQESTEDEVVKPRGRLRKLGCRLLNGGDEIWVPVTQEPMPLTEEHLAEQADILTQLGTSPESALVRARLQSASLLSDMESFKAANPTSELGDFVRWYSPRDITGDTLSQRMRIPGNMWVEVWESALPRPVTQQRRLFNETTEAEKLLHQLTVLPSYELATQLMPCLLVTYCLRLQQEQQAVSVLEDIAARLRTATRGDVHTQRPVSSSRRDPTRWNDAALALHASELASSRTSSLRVKFGHYAALVDVQTDVEFTDRLLENTDEPVIGGADSNVGKIICAMLERGETQPRFPPPAAKEYILRTRAPRPGLKSCESLAHRLYATITLDDFRVATAVSTDNQFH